MRLLAPSPACAVAAAAGSRACACLLLLHRGCEQASESGKWEGLSNLGCTCHRRKRKDGCQAGPGPPSALGQEQAPASARTLGPIRKVRAAIENKRALSPQAAASVAAAAAGQRAPACACPGHGCGRVFLATFCLPRGVSLWARSRR